ncbi:MAG: ABC transporter permease, partial [Chloroflexota bacterium]
MSQHNLSFQHRLRTLLVRQYRVAIAFVVLVILFSVNAYFNPRIFEPFLIQNMVNQSMTLVLAGMAQTCVVLTSGIDLSVGPIISLTNSLASTVFVDTPFGMVGTAILVLCVGALCGLINGLIVVFGRLQPIIITLATGSIYSGIALFLRPTPGGFVHRPFADLLTDRLGLLPHAAIVLLVVILFVWTPYRRSKWGLWLYAIGGNEGAAYMSGVNVRAAKLGAYIMGGLFAGMAGLFLSA